MVLQSHINKHLELQPIHFLIAKFVEIMNY